MRKLSFLLALVLLPVICRGQEKVEDDFERYVREQKSDFDSYVRGEEKSFKDYCDSLNREFVKYLAEAWPDYPLKEKETPLKKPVPPAVYKPDAVPPQPNRQPVKDIPLPEPPSLPLPDAQGKSDSYPLPEVPAVPPSEGVKMQFYGTEIILKRADYDLPHLKGVDETSVAAYWRALSQLPYTDWVGEVNRQRSALRLNDWGMYQLINRIFEARFSQRDSNEQTVFAVFMLNQLGFKAKIGRSQQTLLPLIAFNCDVFNTSFFRYGNEGGTVYTVFNPTHAKLSTVQSCRMEYGGATRLMEMSLDVAPALSTQEVLQPLKVDERLYRIAFDKNYMQFLGTYPCVDFRLYAESEPSAVFRQSMETELYPLVQGKSQEEAVNNLLHFVQYAFRYQTDNTQFGYERWFFPEETIASSYSDCEDRAILFSQLVYRLLKMKVVLVYYPGRHLAAAVRFDNPDTKGDYLEVDGEKYLICDPTYIGASLGMGMPNLADTPVEIIRLNR